MDELMAVQVVDLSTGRFSNHKSFLPRGAGLSLLRLEQYCIGLYIIVRMHWWTIIHLKPRCSAAIGHSLVPWLDQLSSKWDRGFCSGLTKYRICRGQRCNCLLWLLFNAAGPKITAFDSFYFFKHICFFREFIKSVEQIPGRGRTVVQ